MADSKADQTRIRGTIPSQFWAAYVAARKVTTDAAEDLEKDPMNDWLRQVVLEAVAEEAMAHRACEDC